MKKLLSIIIFTALLGIVFGFCLCFYWHNWDSNQRYKQGYFDGYSFIKPIEDLQRQVGAEPDGIIGPNTIAKYEKALCDQYAEQSMCSNVREFDEAMLARMESKVK